MPFKSQAQRAKFHALVAEGKMSQATLDAWESETPKHGLPERIGPKKTTHKAEPKRKHGRLAEIARKARYR